MSKKYRTKPCEIEAVQWNGSNLEEILDFAKEYVVFDNNLKLETLEGIMNASIGDFIIRGLRGEYYLCKADVFEKKYEEIK